MHTSTVTLREGNIVNIAKDVIRPTGWNCEWNVSDLQKPSLCRIVLNSYNAYLKHLIRHCHQNKQGNGLVCRLPRCNIAFGVSIGSQTDLINHIQHSHLSRVQLSCPIRGCPSISFSRPTLLENHFMEEHEDLIDQEVPYSSPLLVSLWRPFYPNLSEEPPSLPGQILPGSVLVPPIRGTFRGSLADVGCPVKEDLFFHIPSSQRTSQLSPMKRSQLPPVDREETQALSGSAIEFEDLPKSQDAYKTAIVRRKIPMYELSGPQEILDPEQFGFHVPQGSILYHNFVRIQGLGEDDSEDNEENGEEDQKV